jgi:sugar phosphate isomerase/epimerase
MHTSRSRSTLRAARAASFLAALPCLAGGLAADFFAFDNGTGRDQKLPLTEQAAILRRAGYAGMGLFTGTSRIPEVLAALDDRKLRLLSIYVHSSVDAEPRLDPGLADGVRQLAGRETMILLTVRGSGAGAEDRAVENVRRAADLAAESGLRVCLYPHVGFHVETTRDALRVARKAGRPNVGVALNLYHTVLFHRARCGGDDFDMAALLREALPRLWLVSVNGIETTPEGSRIARLDQGEYDVAAFLRLLDQAGYSGPVALQCYQVPGEIEDNLNKSMQAWRAMLRTLPPASR